MGILHREWCRLWSFFGFKVACFYGLIGLASKEKRQKKVDSSVDKVSNLRVGIYHEGVGFC
jgi:hypothetical protein